MATVLRAVLVSWRLERFEHPEQLGGVALMECVGAILSELNDEGALVGSNSTSTTDRSHPRPAGCHGARNFIAKLKKTSDAQTTSHNEHNT